MNLLGSQQQEEGGILRHVARVDQIKFANPLRPEVRVRGRHLIKDDKLSRGVRLVLVKVENWFNVHLTHCEAHVICWMHILCEHLLVDDEPLERLIAGRVHVRLRDQERDRPRPYELVDLVGTTTRACRRSPICCGAIVAAHDTDSKVSKLVVKKISEHLARNVGTARVVLDDATEGGNKRACELIKLRVCRVRGTTCLALLEPEAEIGGVVKGLPTSLLEDKPNPR